MIGTTLPRLGVGLYISHINFYSWVLAKFSCDTVQAINLFPLTRIMFHIVVPYHTVIMGARPALER